MSQPETVSFFGRELVNYHIYLDNIPASLRCDTRGENMPLGPSSEANLHAYLLAVKSTFEEYLSEQINGYNWYRRPMTFHVWNPAEQLQFSPSKDEVEEMDPLVDRAPGSLPYRATDTGSSVNFADLLTNLRSSRPMRCKKWTFPVCPHIFGALAIDEAIDDEWHALRLLLHLTARFPDLTVRITDTSSEHFVLAEASPALPPWLDSPERAKYRIWLRQGRFHVVRRPRPSLHVPSEIDDPNQQNELEQDSLDQEQKGGFPVSVAAADAALEYVRGEYGYESWPDPVLQCALLHRIEATTLYPFRSLLYSTPFTDNRILKALKTDDAHILNRALASSATGYELMNNSAARLMLLPTAVAAMLETCPEILVSAISSLFAESGMRNSYNYKRFLLKDPLCLEGAELEAKNQIPQFVLAWVRLPKLVLAQLLRCRIQPHKSYLAMLPSDLPAEVRTSNALHAADGIFLRGPSAEDKLNESASTLSDLCEPDLTDPSELMSELAQSILLGARVVVAIESFYDSGNRKRMRLSTSNVQEVSMETSEIEDTQEQVKSERWKVKGLPIFSQSIALASALSGMPLEAQEPIIISSNEILMKTFNGSKPAGLPSSVKQGSIVPIAEFTRYYTERMGTTRLIDSKLCPNKKSFTQRIDYRKVLQDACLPIVSSVHFSNFVDEFLTQFGSWFSGKQCENPPVSQNEWLTRLGNMMIEGPSPVWVWPTDSKGKSRVTLPSYVGLFWLNPSQAWGSMEPSSWETSEPKNSHARALMSFLKKHTTPASKFIECLASGEFSLSNISDSKLSSILIESLCKEIKQFSANSQQTIEEPPAYYSDEMYKEAMQIHSQSLKHAIEWVQRLLESTYQTGYLDFLALSLGVRPGRKYAQPPQLNFESHPDNMTIQPSINVLPANEDQMEVMSEGLDLNDSKAMEKLDHLLGFSFEDPFSSFGVTNVNNEEKTLCAQEVIDIESDHEAEESSSLANPRGMIYSLIEGVDDQATDASWVVKAENNDAVKRFADILDKQKAKKTISEQTNATKATLSEKSTFYLTGRVVKKASPKDIEKLEEIEDADSVKELSDAFSKLSNFIEGSGDHYDTDIRYNVDGKGEGKSGDSKTSQKRQPDMTAEFLSAFSAMHVDVPEKDQSNGKGMMSNDFMDLMKLIQGLDELESSKRHSKGHPQVVSQEYGGLSQQPKHRSDDDENGSDDGLTNWFDESDETDEADFEEEEEGRPLYSNTNIAVQENSFEATLGLNSQTFDIGDEDGVTSDDEHEADQYDVDKMEIISEMKKSAEFKGVAISNRRKLKSQQKIETSHLSKDIPQDVIEELWMLEQGGFLEQDEDAYVKPKTKKKTKKEQVVQMKKKSPNEAARVPRNAVRRFDAEEEEEEAGEAEGLQEDKSEFSMADYMAALDAELKGESILEPHLSRHHHSTDGDLDEEASHRAALTVHVLENLANSQMSQEGMPGPASTMLGILGVNIPQGTFTKDKD